MQYLAGTLGDPNAPLIDITAKGLQLLNRLAQRPDFQPDPTTL